MSLVHASSVDAQEREAEHKEDVEEVVVTGTNMRGLPREYVASPVFTYSAKEMEQSGLGALSEYIQTLPQNLFGDLSEAATTGVGFGTGLDGAVAQNQFDGFSAFSLRGLGSDATVSRLGTIFNPTDLTMNATLGWQRGPLSIGSIVYHSAGFTDTREGHGNEHIGSYTTASAAIGWTFARDHRSAWLADSSIALVVSNVFDRQPPRIEDEVLTYSPVNSPAYPRTIALTLNKRI